MKNGEKALARGSIHDRFLKVSVRPLAFLWAGEAVSQFDRLSESDYFAAVFSALGQMDQAAIDDWAFVITTAANGEPIDPAEVLAGTGKTKVALLWLGAEKGSVPRAEGFDLVLAAYANRTDARTRALPLGYMNGRVPSSDTPLLRRGVDVFFAGTLNANRFDLVLAFSHPYDPRTWLVKLLRPFRYRRVVARACRAILGFVGSPRPRNRGVQFVIGSAWSKALDAKTYVAILEDSKVVLCPRGWESTETFRHYEGLRAGCAMVSEPLPDVEFYRGLPASFVDDWRDAPAFVEDLLGRIREGHLTSEAQRAFYEKSLSPDATARYIVRAILSRNV